MPKTIFPQDDSNSTATTTTITTDIESTNHVDVALSVPVACDNNIGRGSTPTVSSWGDAFAAAAKIQPLPEADWTKDEMKAMESGGNGNEVSGLTKVSQLAQSYLVVKKGEIEDRVGESGRKKKAKRSADKKNKKHSSHDDDEKIGCSNTETQQQFTESEKEVKKRERKTETRESDEESFNVIRKKKKKKKKKKRKKHEDKSENPTDFVDDDAHDEHTTPLEGKLVRNHDGSDIMVLVDVSKGIVYSATERCTDHGEEHVKIGSVVNGKVVLTPKTSPSNDMELSFPFPTDPDDHCESPLEAYQHISPLLQKIPSSQQQLSIYDPYYCNGAMVANLNSIGFPNVYNKKEDCYAKWQSSPSCLNFDILVTNPPYSDEHIPKLMQYLTCHLKFGNRPWLLLMPTWVHKKPYYTEALQHRKPFYLVPKKRYVYLPPKGFRDAKKSDTHKKSAPFTSMWFVWGGTNEATEQLYKKLLKERQMGGGSADGCDLARSKSALRDLRRKEKR